MMECYAVSKVRGNLDEVSGLACALMALQISTLPNFLVIGAMKCATTSLCDLFAAQPHMVVCTSKEPESFSDDTVLARGWGWYELLWGGCWRKNCGG